MGWSQETRRGGRSPGTHRGRGDPPNEPLPHPGALGGSRRAGGHGGVPGGQVAQALGGERPCEGVSALRVPSGPARGGERASAGRHVASVPGAGVRGTGPSSALLGSFRGSLVQVGGRSRGVGDPADVQAVVAGGGCGGGVLACGAGRGDFGGCGAAGFGGRGFRPLLYGGSTRTRSFGRGAYRLQRGLERAVHAGAGRGGAGPRATRGIRGGDPERRRQPREYALATTRGFGRDRRGHPWARGRGRPQNAPPDSGLDRDPSPRGPARGVARYLATNRTLRGGDW